MYNYLNRTYKNTEELKKHYRELTKKYHPDINSNGLEHMKQINNEYEELFKLVNTTEEKASDFIDIIDKIINLDIDIDIVGSWIWVGGNTFDHKDTLKKNGFKWASKKKLWYYNPDKTYKKKSKKQFSYKQIQSMYETESIKKSNRVSQLG